MDARIDERQAELEAVAFAGDTLAPFFLQDPRTGTAGPPSRHGRPRRRGWLPPNGPSPTRGEARAALGLMTGRPGRQARPTTSSITPPVVRPAEAGPPGAGLHRPRVRRVRRPARWPCARGCAGAASRASWTTRPPRTTSASCSCSWRGSRAIAEDLDEFPGAPAHLVVALPRPADRGGRAPFYEGLARLAKATRRRSAGARARRDLPALLSVGACEMTGF